VPDPTPLALRRAWDFCPNEHGFDEACANCTSVAKALDGFAAAAIQNAYARGRTDQRERDAQLHDSISPGCDCEPHGTGAMGAILAYRDCIRSTKD